MNRIFYTLKKIIIFFSPLTKLLIKIYRNKIFIAIKYSLILFKSIIQFSDTKITILKRPKLSKHVSRSPSFDYSDFSICFQGPFYDPFTLDTIKIYRKMFGNIAIILATWKDTLDNKIISELTKLDVEILSLQHPKTPFTFVKGFNATTLQIFSTLEALKRSKERKILFAVKHRTDQRALEPDWLYRLYFLQKKFTNKNDILIDRILVVASSTMKNRIYGIGDQFHFGYTEDLLKFWNLPYFIDGIDELVNNEQQTSPFVINDTAVFSETYLMSKFLKTNGYKLKWTLEDYWSALQKYFLIFDDSYIDFTWEKYDSKITVHPKQYLEKFDHEFNYEGNYSMGMSFSDWLILNQCDQNSLPWKKIKQERWINNNSNGLPPYFKKIK